MTLIIRTSNVKAAQNPTTCSKKMAELRDSHGTKQGTRARPYQFRLHFHCRLALSRADCDRAASSVPCRKSSAWGADELRCSAVDDAADAVAAAAAAAGVEVVHVSPHRLRCQLRHGQLCGRRRGRRRRRGRGRERRREGSSVNSLHP